MDESLASPTRILPVSSVNTESVKVRGEALSLQKIEELNSCSISDINSEENKVDEVKSQPCSIGTDIRNTIEAN
jgi:hypothetical protein